ncbi:VCBS repeat-containing protein [Arcticibacter eurypsychrophilus]|uniref:VCBS repeat-containing protein n=1 Tax=Arcticibacter eurypsychrophilus TaxID=1434752 RepID=UPI00084D5443|nr:VCBS repeat-containing protein [Arcticibacter eurypsychrophilus]
MKNFPLVTLILCALFFNSCKKKTLFEEVPSSHSGIHFSNTITESDSINPLDVVNIYNGGGVGIGDFNNDGLSDVYLTGNMVPNRLYLNKGDFKFEDITEVAQVEGMGRWGRGTSVIDINNDGLMDIYVCNTIYADSLRRTNLLYVNQGLNKDGIPVFKDQAAAYGLDAHEQSTMASFFDYDNDGDLDMYLTVNTANSSYNPNVFGSAKYTPNHSIGKLYQNDWEGQLKHPVFHDVSAKAGITLEGYGHAATTVDINNDGWKDIYVSNDFVSNNILYINNHDGTFTNRSKEYFKHTSFNSMGNDIVDINNDGLADVIELDMNPEDNYRKKMMLGPSSYQTNQNFDQYGFQYQYVRNTLQVNQGPRPEQQGQLGSPGFSEVGFLSGISQTDWSWAPVVADFNNDSFRDIIITNGFPKDVSDHDFMTYRQEAYAVASKQKILEQIPEIKLHNYAYVNNGDLTFKDVSKEWGLTVKNFSNGAVYADLDNDGALDMVINNINDEASLYRNTSRDDKNNLNNLHYLKINFIGNEQNVGGLGATAEIYYDHGKKQVYEHNTFRGYLSTVESTVQFGLGKVSQLDSVIIKWQNGKKQKLTNVKADIKLNVKEADAKAGYSWNVPQYASNSLFKEVTDSVGINYFSHDADFIDFTIQKLLPHKLSEYSPALAVGDMDKNGLDDIVIGGSSSNTAQVFFQLPNGKFKQHALVTTPVDYSKPFNDAGLLLFDADGDGNLDLYASSGGYQYESNNPAYQDRLYMNDGKGNFTLSSNALPLNNTSKLCVRACDYNQDGKLDLFVSGRVNPWNYPKPVSSFIFRNDSEKGHSKFTDVTSSVAPALQNMGMVCDALFTDFDNDKQPDLILGGEWMPITFLKNNHGKFEDVTSTTGLKGKTGWWNTIIAGDFRHTGRMDYIVGNVGLNTLFKASDEFPVSITANDFDKNGGFIAIPSMYFPDKNGVRRDYPIHGREDMLKQMISLKKKFTNYKSYAEATMDKILSPEQMEGAIKLQANMLQSCFLRNDGNGKFTMIPLLKEAQVSVLNGMVVDDFDGDGNLDVAINGNDFGTDVATGRYDALNGLMLKGNGKGGFKPLTILQSGIYLPGNGRALVKLKDSKNGYLLAASQNKGKLQILRLKSGLKNIKVEPSDASAVLKFKNGSSLKQEFYYGSSFLSQSGRFLSIGKDVTGITITNSKKKERTVQLN